MKNPDTAASGVEGFPARRAELCRTTAQENPRSPGQEESGGRAGPQGPFLFHMGTVSGNHAEPMLH